MRIDSESLAAIAALPRRKIIAISGFGGPYVKIGFSRPHPRSKLEVFGVVEEKEGQALALILHRKGVPLQV